MAEVLGILGLLFTSAEILGEFASYTSKWRLLSDRLFDIKEGLDAAELTLKSWQRKYDVQDRRPVIYMHVLFGKPGWERMSQTLGSIRIVSKILKSDIDKVIGRALAAGPARSRNSAETADGKLDEELVQSCLRRIKRNTSWSRKFQYSVLGRADDLELQLERLHRKIGMLERFSDYFLEKEHPEIFHTIKRLPGRRVILKIGDGKSESVQNNLLDALSARKDAELLHRASGPGNQIHIGLSVPQIHKRDFAFLLNLAGKSHEIHVHPVRIKAINDRSRVPTEIAAAIPKLLRDSQDPCYMLPSRTRSDGFQVSIPPRKSLLDLEYKDSLSTILRDQDQCMSQQVLYPQDQVAIACGIAQGSFRLIGSQWLQFLDCRNVRWRRSVDGKWTSMMAATAGDTSVTRTLDRCKDASLGRRDKRDLSKHIQIFRIGLLLAEIALKTPISYVDYDPSSCTVKIYISSFNGDGEPVDATEIAEEVQNKTNVLMGNIVFFCLSALQEKDKLSDREIEASYYKEVLKDVEELEAIVKADKKRSNGGSGTATPMSGRSFGSYVY
jgi:hypothetical protein